MKRLAKALGCLCMLTLVEFAAAPPAKAATCVDCIDIGWGYGEFCGVVSSGFLNCRIRQMYIEICIPSGGACGSA